MTGVATWHGTREEWAHLWLAIGSFCTCEFDEMTGAERAICGGHAMLEDQAILDHLLHVRRLSEWFIHHEWGETGPSHPAAAAPSDLRR